MGYVLAAVLAVFCLGLLLHSRRLSREQRARQEEIGQLKELLRQREQQLDAKKAELLALCGAVSDGVVLVDGDRLVPLNERARIPDRAAPGEFSCEGRQYRADPALDGRLLLIRDVTEEEQAEKMRQELTANVSHELKTPLHAISGYAEMMAQGMARPEDMAGFAGKIYAEAGRMIRLVEDILNLSRLDAGDSYQWEVLDLFETTRRVVERLRPAAQKAGVSLILSGKPVRVRAIEQLTVMVIHNLCDNAIKYNRPDGRVEVQVVEQGDGAVLTVVDTGIGIPRESQGRVFERFYRVDKSRSKAVGGTGLGLSIVKHAARVMNARVELQSDEGQGTTVTVTFEGRGEI